MFVQTQKYELPPHTTQLHRSNIFIVTMLSSLLYLAIDGSDVVPKERITIITPDMIKVGVGFQTFLFQIQQLILFRTLSTHHLFTEFFFKHQNEIQSSFYFSTIIFCLGHSIQCFASLIQILRRINVDDKNKIESDFIRHLFRCITQCLKYDCFLQLLILLAP